MSVTFYSPQLKEQDVKSDFDTEFPSSSDYLSLSRYPSFSDLDSWFAIFSNITGRTPDSVNLKTIGGQDY